MVKYLSIATLFGTAVLLADAGRANDACQDQIGTTCSAEQVVNMIVCADGAECVVVAAPPQLAVMEGAELPPLTDMDLLIAMPIVPDATEVD